MMAASFIVITITLQMRQVFAHQQEPLLTNDIAGIVALASAIKDMRAMTSLNLSKNLLSAEGAMHIAKAIKVSKCGCGHLASASCPSGRWLTRCRLLLSPGQ
jgi:hypothetical protein